MRLSSTGAPPVPCPVVVVAPTTSTHRRWQLAAVHFGVLAFEHFHHFFAAVSRLSISEALWFPVCPEEATPVRGCFISCYIINATMNKALSRRPSSSLALEKINNEMGSGENAHLAFNGALSASLFGVLACSSG